jgi:alanine racemase
MSGTSVGECLIDLGAIEANTAAICRHVADVAARRGSATGQKAAAPAVMAVVKADGYGHGIHAAARAAVSGGAGWLGVATAQEALALRAAGLSVPVLCWLGPPGGDSAELIGADVQVTVSAQWRLAELLAAAERAGRPVQVQLKVDTGLGRGGAPPGELPALVDAVAGAVRAGRAKLTGVWSHLACSEIAEHPANDEQDAALLAAVAVVRAAGLDPGLVHVANSGAVLARPDLHHDLVRVGLALYGYSPLPPGVRSPVPLRPAMTLRSRLAGVKSVPAGQHVSYGWTWTAARDTVLGLVPIGYADGILRAFSPGGEVFVGGRRAPLVGAVCMDQFVVDLGPLAQDEPGDDVVLFGPDPDGLGVPSADDWARAGGTISWEVLTLPRGRVTRR